MADILHRISIAAPVDEVHDLIATTGGIEQWWTGRTVEGGTAVGERFSLFFRGDSPAAVMEVQSDSPEEVSWLCVDGPKDWFDTRITFTLKPLTEGRTTLMFEHSGWRESNEFMAGCSTNWGAYLTSLKSGLEGDGFGAYPEGEISLWS